MEFSHDSISKPHPPSDLFGLHFSKSCFGPPTQFIYAFSIEFVFFSNSLDSPHWCSFPKPHWCPLSKPIGTSQDQIPQIQKKKPLDFQINWSGTNWVILFVFGM